MKATSPEPRLALGRRTLGAVHVIDDLTLPSHVLRLVDVEGTQYIAKQHHRPDRFTQEVRAYMTWARHLAHHAPRLVAHDEASHTLLLTALPGTRGDVLASGSRDLRQAYEAAGATLRVLHDSTAFDAKGMLGSMLAGRLEGWIDRAAGLALLTSAEARHLRVIATELATSEISGAVCHLDYQPRNWLLGEVFRVLDFEHMRPDARIRDFARLEFRQWAATPRLRLAFFEGYGRQLTEPEQRLLNRFGAIEAATALVRGHEEADHTLSARGRAILDLLM
ncbi:phosphotransferase [Embleya sp. NPDC055664]